MKNQHRHNLTISRIQLRFRPALKLIHSNFRKTTFPKIRPFYHFRPTVFRTSGRISPPARHLNVTFLLLRLTSPPIFDVLCSGEWRAPKRISCRPNYRAEFLHQHQLKSKICTKCLDFKWHVSRNASTYQLEN